ncbi:WYL domain-containing protein [Paenibacillus sp. N1-5-1-14]|uniref:helix-turn-helix transcriptional regulator n=1 Tax=Paenibacillus radicibacter TaxID=2972488 RepID=UPI0021593E03|nr:WYL domain-containing protein [Paenibacillus radicibacter]MCR8642808.1 WYL domain-containing protein [Paenibacillus radicibacter]
MNNRRLAIMQMMDSRKKFTARELAERFEVSIRTIQRDLDYLQQMGFPLYTDLGKLGGYRVMPNRILPPLQLNQNEAFGLFLMIQYLEKIHDFPFESIRSHLAEQYYAGLPTDVQESIDRMKKHIGFMHNQVSEPAPLTTHILQAAMDKREVSYMYRSQSGLKRTQAYPLGIYYENGFWYMPAQRGEKVILYRVDRMSEIEVLEQVDASIPTLQEWFKKTDERESVEVVLQFTDTGARIAQSDPLLQGIRSKQWHGSSPIEELPFLSRRLLKYGVDVKVIAPIELREMVVKLLRESIQQYE